MMFVRRWQALWSLVLVGVVAGAVVGQPALVASDPVAEGTLAKVKDNVITLTFDGPISLGVGSPLVIRPMDPITGLGDDVGDGFTYSVEPDGVTLVATEDGAVLDNLTWYQIVPAAGFGVSPFVFGVNTLVGDADGSGQVKALDLGTIWAHKNELTDGRWDIDGSGQVKALDLGMCWAHKNEAAVGEPVVIAFVAVDDPGVSGHEAFHGEIGKYEVTNAQYCAYLNDALAVGDVRVGGGFVYGDSGPYVDEIYYELVSDWAQISYSGDYFYVEAREGYSMSNHPVVEVSWYGAAAFASYYGWWLPTEWEWQAVADYDGSYTYGCGTSIDQSKANYNRANPLGLTSLPYTNPVDHYLAYGYGLHDMAGNAWEWTDSWYPNNPVYRVLRSGSWNMGNPIMCKVIARALGYPDMTDYDTGFRVCR